MARRFPRATLGFEPCAEAQAKESSVEALVIRCEVAGVRADFQREHRAVGKLDREGLVIVHVPVFRAVRQQADVVDRPALGLLRHREDGVNSRVQSLTFPLKACVLWGHPREASSQSH